MTDVVAARQVALAAEERALYGYAVVGPRLDAADRQLVRACIAAHTSLRDALVTVLEAAGVTPVAPRADYPELYPVGDVATARARAVELEQTCAAAWRFVYAQLVAAAAAPSRSASSTASDTSDRADAQRALTDSAVRATRWRLRAGDATPTVPFPGLT